MGKSEATRNRFDVERACPGELHEAARPRAVRNGLPPFKPYVYRGTGEDQYAPGGRRYGPRPGVRVR